MHRSDGSTESPPLEPASASIRTRGDRVAKLLLWGTTVLLGTAFLRTVQLQVWPDETVLSLMGRRHATVAEIRPRGDIYDRKGRLIATTVLGHDLGVDPKFLMDVADKVTTDAGDPIPNPIAWLADTVSMHTGIEREMLEDRLGPELVVDVAALMHAASAQGEEDPLTPLAADIARNTGLDRRDVESILFDDLDATRVVLAGPRDLRDTNLRELRAALPEAVTLEGLDARYVRLAQAEDLRDVDLAMLRSELPPGVVLTARPDRRSNASTLASSLVGSVGAYEPPNARLGTEGRQRGRSGVEHARDGQLKQTRGRMTYQKDARGRATEVREGDYVPGGDGDDIDLSIDLVIQQIAETRLAEAVAAHKAVGGWIVVVDPRTGDVLAAHDILDNAEARRRGPTIWPPNALDPARDELGEAHARNRVWTDVYEPGSTFKTMFWAWAVQRGLARPDETVTDRAGRTTPGGGFATSGLSFSYPGQRGLRRVRDAYGTSKSDWSTCLEKSLNTGMAMVALRMADDDRRRGFDVGAGMHEMFRDFGFSHRTGIDMGAAEQTGRITPRFITDARSGERKRTWFPLWSQITVSFGQEIAVTPLQMIRAYCPIARNDGRLPALRLVRSTTTGIQAVPTSQVLDRETVMETRTVLRRVVENVNRKFDRPERGYELWGKSGTAQRVRYVEKTDPVTGERTWTPAGYWDRDTHGVGHYNSSFIGAGPFDEPKLVVACCLEDPEVTSGLNIEINNGRGYYGSSSAGPVVLDVLEASLEYLGVRPEVDRTIVAADG
ncbi:MAG: peptidoglycan D,D-transpeptidase FtsI family protein [Planctomycetota bacterium]|jgi:cell division protein FtsI/penicillin-binding protein 2